MKRKVIKQGHNTLTITLPAKWVEKNSVKAGDEVEIEEDEKKLLIGSGSVKNILKEQLDVTNLEPMVLRYILALYKKGVDEIDVLFEKPELLGSIQKAIGKEAVGFEIVSQGRTNCLIKNISVPVQSEFDSILKRTFLLMITTAEESYDFIKNLNFEHLKNVAFLEEANNRFTTAIRRILNKNGSDKYRCIGPIYYIAEELEKIADQFKYLCNYLYDQKDKKNKIKPKIIGEYKKIIDMLRLYYEIFYNFNQKKVVEIGDLRKSIVKNCMNSLTEKNNVVEVMLLHYTLVISQKIFCLVGPYLIIKED